MPASRLHIGAVTTALALGAAMLMVGCASSGKWERPKAYTDSAAQATEHARRLAEAEREALALTQRAIRADDKGDHDEAVHLCIQAINTYPDLGIAWHTMGVALLAQEERQRAWESFSRAAQLDPISPEPLYNMGVILQENMLLEQAKRYHVEALERKPTYLPSLRESVRIDRMMARVDKETLQRITRALMLEDEPAWREYFQRTLLQGRSDEI
jgi:tetratricopeptide (TPR) repeat protein